MKTDFFGLAKEAFDFTIKYKVLWIFGFVLAFLQTGSNFYSNVPDSSELGSFNEFERQFSSQSGLASMSDTSIYLILGGVLVCALVLSLIAWYLSRVSTIAINRAVKHDAEGNSHLITFKSLWSDSQNYIWKIILFDLIIILGAIVISLIIVLPIVLLAAVTGPFVIFLLCCVFVICAPLLIVIGVLVQTSIVLITNYNYGISDALQESWRLFKKEWANYILAVLVGILISIPYFIIAFFLAIVMAVGIIAIAVFLFSSMTSTPVLAIVLVLLVGLLAGVIYSGVSAPFMVFIQTYWTKFFSKIKEQNS